MKLQTGDSDAFSTATLLYDKDGSESTTPAAVNPRHRLTSTLEFAGRQLRISFAEQLPAKIKEVGTRWAKIRAGEAVEDTLKILHFMVHKLTGSGTTFGFSALSMTARALENALLMIIEGDAKLTKDHVDLINQHIAALKQAATTPDAVTTISAHVSAHDAQQDIAHNLANPLIFMVEDDDLFARDIALKVNLCGYTVQCFSNLALQKSHEKDSTRCHQHGHDAA